MSLTAILVLGFLLGVRHATDADHVVAISAIVSRERSLRAAAPIGMLWGVGHSLTVLLAGGAIVLFGIVVPPHVGLGLELVVAFMLIGLGALNVRNVLRDARAATQRGPGPGLRPLVVGVVHGLAGSAAIALLVVGAIRSAPLALGYLVVFGTGTLVGMLLVTTLLAVPIIVAARRFEKLHRSLGIATGLASVLLGAALIYQIGFVDGLFTGHAHWLPG